MSSLYPGKSSPQGQIEIVSPEMRRPVSECLGGLLLRPPAELLQGPRLDALARATLARWTWYSRSDVPLLHEKCQGGMEGLACSPGIWLFDLWATHFQSLHLGFLICKMEVVMDTCLVRRSGG